MEKIALVRARAEAGNLFDERERAALTWAETVTRVADTGVPDEAYEGVREVFDERDQLDEHLQPDGDQLSQYPTGGTQKLTLAASNVVQSGSATGLTFSRKLRDTVSRCR